MASFRTKRVTCPELLFCRLNFMNVVGCEIFGEDLKQEAANRFVTVKVAERDGRLGSHYDYLDRLNDEGAVENHDLDWSPVFVDEVTHEVLKRLCQNSIGVSDPWLLGFLQQNNRSIHVLVEQLRDSRLASLAGNELRLLTQHAGAALFRMGALSQVRTFRAGCPDGFRFSNGSGWLEKEALCKQIGTEPSESGVSRRMNALCEDAIGKGHAISAPSPDSVRTGSEGGGKTGGLLSPGTKPALGRDAQ